MTFYAQPDIWQTGPHALKHALAILGVFADEGEIARVARARRRYGTNGLRLRLAARRYGCDLVHVRSPGADRAHREMTSHLRRGRPALLRTGKWNHWVTAVKAERGRFILIDSLDPSVLDVLSWRGLERRWFCEEEGDDGPVYDFHPVVPRFRVRAAPRLTAGRVRFLRRPENRVVSRRWNDYVVDLLDVCKVRTPLSEKVLSLGEFLARHEGMILDQVAFWHGEIDRRQAGRVLRHLRFVADTVGMVVPEKDEKRTIAALAVLLTLWAEGESKGAPIYDA